MNDALSQSKTELIGRAAAQLEHLRTAKPRVHCITNAAAQVFTANLLLAAGAIPSLTIAEDEVPFFTSRAQSVLVNLGTLDQERKAAIPAAIHTAKTEKKHWVLDPVFVDASPPRLNYARSLLAERPSILRCNESEFAALTGAPFHIDTLHSYARTYHCIVALTGAVDRVTDGKRLIQLHNGHPWMSQTTAMGCAGTALIAALAGAGAAPFEAAVHGLLLLGVAGEIAASHAHGPGTFVPCFLDRLASLSCDEIQNTARIEL